MLEKIRSFWRPKKLSRSAGVLQHPDCLIIHSQRQMSSGILIGSLPVHRFAVTADDGEVGMALADALDNFSFGDIATEDLNEFRSNFLKATGFRSWKALEGPARSCWAFERGNELIFTPLRNGGQWGDEKGFQPFGAVDVTVHSTASHEEIGQSCSGH